MPAVWITLSRFPLLLGSVLGLYLGTPLVQLAATALLFVGLLLDTVDGMVATAGSWWLRQRCGSRTRPAR